MLPVLSPASSAHWLICYGGYTEWPATFAASRIIRGKGKHALTGSRQETISRALSVESVNVRRAERLFHRAAERRTALLFRGAAAGLTHSELAHISGLSRGRVGQILSKDGKGKE